VSCLQDIALQEALLRDLLAVTTGVIAFSILTMAWILSKKRHGPLSTTAGLEIYFLTFLVYTVSADSALLYHGYLQEVAFNASLVELLAGTIWVIGIIVFIYTVDNAMTSTARKRRWVTILTVIYTISFGPLIVLGVKPYLIFIGLAVALIFVSWRYLKVLLQLEVARRRFPKLWFILAFNLSGFANFFILADYTYVGFIMKNLCILAGVLILTRVWNELPTAEDLNWLLTLDRLLVVERQSSIPLVDFHFRASNLGADAGSAASEDNGLLVAGAVDGIDRFLDEILADTGGLGEIVHGKKTVMFLRRERFTCMLIADKSMDETRYRMETFALSFEMRYRQELTSFSAATDRFSKAESLIRAAFY